MQSLDLQVISQLCQWLRRGEPAWLCTVIDTWGSSPRRPGSLMVFHSSGTMVGSLSGGCIEEDLLEQLQLGQLAAESAEYKLYGETQTEIERFKLPCGGTLGVLIEPIGPDQLSDFCSIEEALARRSNIQRLVNWKRDSGGGVAIQKISLTQSSPTINLQKSDDRQLEALVHVYGPECHLFIIGISEVSRALAQFALAASYRVTVCDPRPELVQQWTIENTQLMSGMPDDAIRESIVSDMAEDDSAKDIGDDVNTANCYIDAHTAIVAVTHDPRIDDMGLMEAFNSTAFYIGAMGSAKTSEKRRERLRQLDISDEQLLRLHAPIGLNIGSKTPAEIAIAIMAELIAERAKVAKSLRESNSGESVAGNHRA